MTSSRNKKLDAVVCIVFRRIITGQHITGTPGQKC